jgi:hypothetical protein
MFTLSNLVQKAQSYIEPTLNNIAAPATTDRRPSKATLFRHQFRLPDTQNPLQEITAELTLSPHHTTRGPGDITSEKDRSQGNHYVGKLHLSEQYLCFSTQGSSFVNTATLSSSSSFTGQTHGAGPAGNGFTLPLCGIRRVERLHSQSYMFALAITTWNGTPDSKTQAPAGQKLTIQLAGSRQACERFCDGLKKGLREGVKEVENLRRVVSHCYSEYLLTDAEEKKGGEDGAKPGKEHPDTGLGMIFRYPGNARKLRDATKIRLWREYLRGTTTRTSATTKLTWYRQRTKRDAHSTTHLPQAHTRWPTESVTRRNVGAHLGVFLLAPPESQPIHRDTTKVLWARVAGDRRDRERPEQKFAGVPRLPK